MADRGLCWRIRPERKSSLLTTGARSALCKGRLVETEEMVVILKDDRRLDDHSENSHRRSKGSKNGGGDSLYRLLYEEALTEQEQEQNTKRHSVTPLLFGTIPNRALPQLQPPSVAQIWRRPNLASPNPPPAPCLSGEKHFQHCQGGSLHPTKRSNPPD